MERDSMGRTNKVQRVSAWMKRASMWRRRRVKEGQLGASMYGKVQRTHKERRVYGSR